MTERSPGRAARGQFGRLMMVFAIVATLSMMLACFRGSPPENPPARSGLDEAEQKRVDLLDGELQQHFDAGDYAAAVLPAREILAIRAATQPDGHWEVRTARAQLSTCERLAAMPPVRQQRVKMAWDSCLQGRAASTRRRFDEAEPHGKKALETFRDVLGEVDYYTLFIENELGYALHQLASYDAAAALFLRELNGYRSLFGEDHPDTARAHDMLASSLHALGDDDGALEHGQTALDGYTRLLGEESDETATSCNSMGSYLESLGDSDKAEAMYRRGLEIRRKNAGERDVETARSYNNVAVVLFHRGRYAEAEELNRKALEIRVAVRPAVPEEIARSRDNLANCLYEQGRFAEAEDLHRLALADRPGAADEDPETILHRSNLGFSLRARGKYDEAEEMWTRAALGFDRARSRVARRGLERAAFSAARSPLMALAASLARHQEPTAAWERWESDLGRGLLDELTARAARTLEPADQRERQGWIDKLQDLEEKIAAAGSPSDGRRPLGNPLKAERDRLRADLETFERGLDAKYGMPTGRVYALEAIQHRLAADVALLGWVDLDLPAQATDANKEHWACLVRSEGEPAWVQLPGTGPGGAWTEDDWRLPGRVRDMVSRPPDPGAEDGWREPAVRLAEQRLGPLRRRLQAGGRLPDVRHLVVLPSPALEGLPVEVLLDAWRIPGSMRTVSYISSGTIYAWLRERRAERHIAARAAGRGKLLAVGNPAGTPESLPWTGREIGAIAGFFPTPPPTLLLGDEASEPNLKRFARDDLLRQFDVIHLATHADIDDRAPMRSWLLLSGQPQAKSPADGDGRITVGQILRTWRLDADLVTLSACRTAMGKRSGGEGPIGFAQALFLAGSQSLVLSLWKVEDEATAILMTHFYREYTRGRRPDEPGRGKAEALRNARSALRSPGNDRLEGRLAGRIRGPVVKGHAPRLPVRKPRHDHPYYWAGFVLIGDPE